MTNMLSLKEAADLISEKMGGLVIPKAGCSYKNTWLISTYPKDGSADEVYVDSLYIVDKNDGRIATFSPTIDIEGFQAAIKNATKL